MRPIPQTHMSVSACDMREETWQGKPSGRCRQKGGWGRGRDLAVAAAGQMAGPSICWQKPRCQIACKPSAHASTAAAAAAEQAGFATPAVELDYKVSAATAGAESLKDMLARLKPYTTPGACRGWAQHERLLFGRVGGGAGEGAGV
jgi:hypothetical protein